MKLLDKSTAVPLGSALSVFFIVAGAVLVFGQTSEKVARAEKNIEILELEIKTDKQREEEFRNKIFLHLIEIENRTARIEERIDYIFRKRRGQ